MKLYKIQRRRGPRGTEYWVYQRQFRFLWRAFKVCQSIMGAQVAVYDHYGSFCPDKYIKYRGVKEVIPRWGHKIRRG